MASSAEDRRVKVTIVTTISDGDADQTIELTVFGKYYRKAEAAYLQYVEQHEEGKMNTIMKLTPEDLLIMRSGALKMRLNFSQGERLRGSYDTPYGKLAVFTKTTKYRHEEISESDPGLVELDYDLVVDGTMTGAYKLRLSYEEVN